jgi:hypothetical protein
VGAIAAFPGPQVLHDHPRCRRAAWVDGGLFLSAGKNTRNAKNLALDSHCVVAVEQEPLDLVVEGEATMVRDAATLRRVAEAYRSTYDWHVTVRDGAFTTAEEPPIAGPPPYDVYEIAPTTAFGIGIGIGIDETFMPTRWRFGHDTGRR